MLEIEKVPELTGTDVLAAREWFSKLYDLGIHSYHADDMASSDELSKFMTPQAARKISEIVLHLFAHHIEWDDPDFLYCLAAEGKFKAESEYPNLIIDTTIPCASRTGYVPILGRELPTIVIEEGNNFYGLTLHTPSGKVSEVTRIDITPLEGAYFAVNEKYYINTSRADFCTSSMRSVNSLADIEGIIDEFYSASKNKPK